MSLRCREDGAPSFVCCLSSCGLGRELTGLSSVSPSTCPAPGSAPSPVGKASSSGRWCAGAAPTVSGSARRPSQTPCRSAACPAVEVSRWGDGSPPPNTQPSLASRPLRHPRENQPEVSSGTGVGMPVLCVNGVVLCLRTTCTCLPVCFGSALGPAEPLITMQMLCEHLSLCVVLRQRTNKFTATAVFITQLDACAAGWTLEAKGWLG